MHRRSVLKSGAGAALFAALAPFPLGFARAPSDRLYFSLDALPKIRAAARSPLLSPTFAEWRSESPHALSVAMDKAVASGDLLSDFAAAMEAMTRQAVVHLVEPSADRRDAIVATIEAAAALPKWDYFYDGDAEIGIMRSSLANDRLLFAREVLGPDLPTSTEDRLLDAIAEKGTLPCYRTIVGMDHPETVVGWRFDDNHSQTYDIDLGRWPEILGAINLRAVPTMGLGIGALALLDRDPRARLWLDTAVSSARLFLDFLSADGSYFEGLSYVGYSFDTLFSFLEAHERVEGTIDWADQANFEGVARYVMAMQAGRNADGSADIVNFSDAFTSVRPCLPSWIARQTGSGLAQYAAETVSRPGYYLDFLWYDPERPATPPPASLENARLDLDWVICRSGWEPNDAVLAFRGGRPANHEHADRNSFFYKVHGERLLTDHYGAAYDWRQPKWLLRQTEAHNAVLIDGHGHQYHDGSEGTNESQAQADLIRFEVGDPADPNRADRVWWCSDATQAYGLVDPDTERVRRTVLFAKPDVVVLFDQVEKGETPSTAAVRFFPDNRDDLATLDVAGGAFTIRRPRATLHGRTFARADVSVTEGRLDLEVSEGVYPFVEVAAGPSRRHEIVTVLVARPADSGGEPTVEVEPDTDGWTVRVGDVRARIGSVDGGVLGRVPDVKWL